MVTSSPLGAGLYFVHKRPMPTWLSDEEGAVLLTLWVVPGASRTEIAGAHGRALKVRVAAAPEHGRANRALIAFLEERLRPARVELSSGLSVRSKMATVTGMESGEVERRLSM